MYKYRVVEACPDGDVPHIEVAKETDAKIVAKRVVSETHHPCFIERFDGERWQRGSIRYMWMFDRVCFWNHG